MKKYLLAILIGLMVASSASAQATVRQGGTGTTTVPNNWVLVGDTTLRLKALATSTLGLLTTNVAEGTNLYYTLSRWATALAGTTTDALAEGSTNKYYSDTLARLALSASAPISYDNSTGVISCPTCGAGGDFPFTPQSWGNSTSTTIGFLNGLMSTASSTLTATTSMSGVNFNAFKQNVSASESTGGVLNINRGTFLGPGIVAYTDASTGGGRLGSFVCDNTGLDTQCLHIRSDSTLETTLNILGSPAGKGIVKIGSNGVGDADASGLSIDTSLSSYLGQGIFLKGNATGKLLNFRTSANEEVLTLLPTGFLGLGTTSPYARLGVAGQVVADYFTGTSTTVASNLNRLITNNATTSENFYITPLGTPAGAFLAIDPDGKVISTSTPAAGSGVNGTGVAGMLAGWTGSDTIRATGTPIFANFEATSTTATSTLNGDLQIGAGAIGNNKVRITADRIFSASNSVGGLLNLTNTSNTGPALVIYTNNGGTSAGNLVNVRCDNTAMAHDCFKIDHDGAGDGLAIAATASASNALSLSNTGVDHTANIAYTGTTADKGALNLTSTNVLGSVFQVTGSSTALGLGKLTHTGIGDADSSVLSLSANNALYAGQGIFADISMAALTQKLLNLRANGIEKLTLLGNGNLGLGTTTPGTTLGVNGPGVFTGTTTAPGFMATSSSYFINSLDVTPKLTTIIPSAIFSSFPTSFYNAEANFASTTIFWGMVNVPNRINVNKMSMIYNQSGSATTTFDIGFYDLDGNQLFSGTTNFSYKSTVLNYPNIMSASVSNYSLAPGNYWVGYVSNATSSFSGNDNVTTWHPGNDGSTPNAIWALSSDTTGKTPLFGTTTAATAGTLPASFTPSSLPRFYANDDPTVSPVPVIRLDN